MLFPKEQQILPKDNTGCGPSKKKKKKKSGQWSIIGKQLSLVHAPNRFIVLDSGLLCPRNLKPLPPTLYSCHHTVRVKSVCVPQIQMLKS